MPVDAASTKPSAQASRRTVIIGSAGTLAVAAQASQITGAATAEAAAKVDPVLHLLRRTTFGPTPALVAEVKKKGTAAWLDAQLKPGTIADAEIDSLLERWPRLSWTARTCRDKIPFEWDVMFDLLQAHLARAIWSRRQLFEVMVDFWTNHLVVPVPISEVFDCAHLYQRDVIRKHALGRYCDMLAAAARHPAMLRVLDNADSSKEAPNENYARELLELHTVGVGHYSETDVKSAAKVLTGLSIEEEKTFTYRYKPEQHYVGKIKVLGWSSENTSARGGEAVALSYLRYLAHHKLTATRIATKLAVRFVSDTPPPSLIKKLATVYLSHDTAIAPVLKALFTSAEFKASTGQKVRTPYQDVIATLRIAGVRPEKKGTAGLSELYWFSTQIGQPPMGWPAPNGYPDVAAAWAGPSSLLARWNFHLATVANWSFTTMGRPKPIAFVGTPLPKTYGALVDRLATRLLVGPVSSTQRNGICAFLGHKATTKLPADSEALGWRLSAVIALLLDTSNFATR